MKLEQVEGEGPVSFHHIIAETREEENFLSSFNRLIGDYGPGAVILASSGIKRDSKTNNTYLEIMLSKYTGMGHCDGP